MSTLALLRFDAVKVRKEDLGRLHALTVNPEGFTLARREGALKTPPDDGQSRSHRDTNEARGR